MAAQERKFVRSPRMTDHEALMWTVEKDPWMNASGASLMIFDRPLDADHFRRTMRAAVVAMPRLYERVVPGLGRLSTPAWAPDPEFDVDYHVREMSLPAPGDERMLLDVAARLYDEPLDRTRPLWKFVMIDGLEGGRGALWSVVHHVIADGIGQMRMAELYQSLERNASPPPEVDLDRVVEAALETTSAKEAGGAGAEGLLDTARHTATSVLRRQAGVLRRSAGEVVLWPADPQRAAEKLSAMSSLVTDAVRQIVPANDESIGSSLWTERSRRRHLERIVIDLAELKAAAKAVDASINDAFLAGLAEGASRYHRNRDVAVQNFNSSLVVSTRTDSNAGGNAFTPVPIMLPGGPMSVRDRLVAISAKTEEARSKTGESGGLGGLSGVLNQLPVSVITRAARSAASKIDFATSNLRSAGFPVFCAKAQVIAMVPMGPVAGTGANITAMSYNGDFHIGLFMDPAAIGDPAAFRDDVEGSFRDMIAELAPPPAPAPKKKRAAKKKASAPKKKPAAKKASAKKRSTRSRAK